MGSGLRRRVATYLRVHRTLLRDICLKDSGQETEEVDHEEGFL